MSNQPTAVTYTIDLHMVSEVLNSNQRLHHHQRARRTAAVRTKAVMARLANRGPTFDRAHCTATLIFRDQRRRDAGNWWPTVKAGIDGICTGPAGTLGRWPHALLPDDDATHLIGPDLRIGKDAGLRQGWCQLALTFTQLTP